MLTFKLKNLAAMGTRARTKNMRPTPKSTITKKSRMSLSLFRFSTCLPLLALLTSCAAGVTYAPADIAPIATSDQRPIVILDKQIDIKLDTGYTRSLKAGSQWMRVGTIAQGQVYRPYNAIFTLEGKHVHEAYLVISNDYLTGFYLPVERGYSPIKQKISLPFTSTTK